MYRKALCTFLNTERENCRNVVASDKPGSSGLDKILYDHFTYALCLNSTQSIPYTDTITGGVKVGMAFYFQGVALSDGKKYVSMLYTL